MIKRCLQFIQFFKRKTKRNRLNLVNVELKKKSVQQHKTLNILFKKILMLDHQCTELNLIMKDKSYLLLNQKGETQKMVILCRFKNL